MFMPQNPQQPDLVTIESLNRAARIISLILGLIFLLFGIVMTILFLSGWVPLIFGIFNIVIFYQINNIDNLLKQQRYLEARSETLVWSIVGIVLAGVIVGIILLISYFKYDNSFFNLKI